MAGNPYKCRVSLLRKRPIGGEAKGTYSRINIKLPVFLILIFMLPLFKNQALML